MDYFPQEYYTYLIKTESDGVISAGTIQTVKKGTVIEGWLECDGSEYDPEQYPELHDMLTNEYAVMKRTLVDKILGRKGKFVGTWRSSPYGENCLPDLRDKVVR